MNRGLSEELLDLFRARSKVSRIITVEELTAGIVRLGELGEVLSTLAGQLVGCTQRGVHDGGEVSVGEVQAFIGAVLNVLAAKVTVQVHLPQANRVGIIVALAHGGNGVDRGLVRHSRQATDSGFHCQGEVRGIHGSRDIEGAKVAGNIATQGLVGEVVVEL